MEESDGVPNFCRVLSISEMEEVTKAAEELTIRGRVVEQAKVCWWRREDVSKRKTRVGDILELPMRRRWKVRGELDSGEVPVSI